MAKQHHADRPGVHHADAEHHIVPISTYLIIFAILMVLLVATVGVTYVDLGPLNVVIALLIAFVKAAIIVLWFMHVKYSSRLIWLAASATLFWVGIMFVLTFNDYLSRPWLAVPGK